MAFKKVRSLQITLHNTVASNLYRVITLARQPKATEISVESII